MKKLIVASCALTCAVSVFAQGTVIFNNVNSAAGLRAPVYNINPANPIESLQGNSSSGLPAGTTVYAGAVLSGTGYSAQLWCAPGANAAETALVIAGAATTFRTGTAAGFVNGSTLTLPNVAKDAAAATFQLRAWDNVNGTITSWDAAVAANVAWGKSKVFTVNAIGGDLNTPPILTGLESFNIHLVPEPSSLALAGLGAAALLIFRRRK